MKTATLRCYDNGGKTWDRYTILPPRWAGIEWKARYCPDCLLWNAIAASAHPFHPQGFGQHVEAQAGRHLGARVPFASLPVDVQQFAIQSFTEE